MEKEKVIEIIKKRFGTSDEDLQDLEVIMSALDGVEKADFLSQEISRIQLEADKALKDLDETWRNRYRDRFFNGDTTVEDIIDRLETEDREAEETQEITLEEFIDEIAREEKNK